MDIQWLGSPNFTAGRDGHSMSIAPAYIVIHTMVGTIDSANARFQQADPVNGVSAHYGVGLDGRIVQWVKEEDASWNAGNFEVNLDSIGIEHEDGGNYNGPRPDALYTASASLVRDICTRYGIPIAHTSLGSSGIIAHREVSATSCPDALDVDRIIREAANMPLDPSNPNDALVIKAANSLLATDGAKDPAGNPMPDHWTVSWNWTYIKQILALVQQLQVDVAKLSQPVADPTAIATALAGNQAFQDALAATVAKHLGKDLANG